MAHTLKICCGTACYVMGGSELLSIEDLLTEEEKEQVRITATPCMNECRKGDDIRPPFAYINGELISRATVDKVLEIIRSNK